MNKDAKIYIAGHRGLVGSAIVRELKKQGFDNLIIRTHKELDLINQQAVSDFFKQEKPNYVILAAAKVGGIVANNTYKADFIYENLQIQNNVIHQSYLHKVTKLLFLGSTCIYPKNAPQPMSEDSLLTSELEYTNEPYAIAKIAGIKMCESYNLQYGTNFISVMPTNLYGKNDNFDLEVSHVLPALLRKMHEAKLNNNPTVEIWGSGKPRREFLYVLKINSPLNSTISLIRYAKSLMLISSPVPIFICVFLASCLPFIKCLKSKQCHSSKLFTQSNQAFVLR
jgi:GDP-L-fucose synthase